MGIWSWITGSRGEAATTDGSTVPVGGSRLGIQTDTEWVEGDIATGGRRLTELLNDSEEVSVWVADALPGATGRGARRSIPTASILFVVPPPQPSDRQRQIHRRLRRVAIGVGTFRVTGLAHVTPGADADPYLLRRSNRFMPLTEATVAGHGLDGTQAAAVVIVNTAHLDTLEELS